MFPKLISLFLSKDWFWFPSKGFTFASFWITFFGFEGIKHMHLMKKWSDWLFEECLYRVLYLPLDFAFFFSKCLGDSHESRDFSTKKINFKNSKKFRLFCANKVVLCVLTKEPRFLTKTTRIFSTSKYKYFFYSHKKRESFLHSKKSSAFVALKENRESFF